MSCMAHPALDQICNGLDQFRIVPDITELGGIVTSIDDHIREGLDQCLSAHMAIGKKMRGRDHFAQFVMPAFCSTQRDDREVKLELTAIFAFTHIRGLSMHQRRRRYSFFRAWAI